MNILALDLSLTGTGVVDGGSASTIKTKLRDEPRLAFLEDTILDLAIDKDLVILEGLAFASKVGKSAERDALHYIVRTRLWRHDIPFALCPPTVLKKYITGKGNAGKDEVMFAVAKQIPLEVKNNNEADASVLYAIALDRLGTPLVDVPRDNRLALDKVAWPEGFFNA